MAAFTDVQKNPANISKYENNPKIQAVLKKLTAKFQGAGGGSSSSSSSSGPK